MVNSFVIIVCIVIQRSFATKDLGCIKRVFPRLFASL